MSRRYWLFLLLAVASQAHDLYLLPSAFRVTKGSVLRIGFHNGDSFPESEVAPHIARLREARVSGQAGSAGIEDMKEAGKETIGQARVPSSGSLLVSVQTVPNFIELDPKKFESYLKDEGLNDVVAWRKQHGESEKPGRERYSKFAKSLIVADHGDGYFGEVLGFPIEIVPLKDPSAMIPGGKLPVKVLFRGNPAAGLQLETAWANGAKHKTVSVGRTDRAGNIDVPLPAAGLWRLHTLKMERCSDRKAADWESFWASLTFEVTGG